MFEIRVSTRGQSGSYGKSWQTVAIEGCPKDGIAAVDFRRAHGIPEAPSNIVELPEFVGESEEFARMLPLNSEANVSLGDINYHYKYQTAAPEAVRDYCRERTAETACNLLLSILALRAEKEAADQAESERAAAELLRARELLGEEIKQLTRKVDYWQKEAARLEEQLKEAREEAEVDAE